ncbi:MAG: hypothetical protein LWW85_11185, partial [Marinilabiliales bacterium]|nr:hypothetical protein [Marinilabiliales bacterium]
PPVSGMSVASFLSANAIIPTNGSARGMMDYNSSGNSWNNYFTNATGGNLASGNGYAVRSASSGSLSFSGTIATNSVTISGLSTDAWNLVGNPFTSAIDIKTTSSDKFLKQNESNLDPSFAAIYLWDQPDSENGKSGKYKIINNTGIDLNSNLLSQASVQVGQGFFVKLKSGVSSVTFAKDIENHHNSSDAPFKSAKTTWPAVSLEVSTGQVKSATIIAFAENMTKGLDPTYDAGLFGTNSNLQISSRLVNDNGIQFAIQALPLSGLNDMTVPLDLQCAPGGQITFSMQSVSLPAGTIVSLEDKKSGVTTPLQITGSSYSTVLDPNSNVSGRFLLHFSDIISGVVEIPEAKSGLSAFISNDHEIKILGEVSSEATASLYDILGRKIYSKRLNQATENVINEVALQGKVFILHVNDGKQLTTIKLKTTH